MVVSIFIASKTKIRSPAFTRWPSWTASLVTRPATRDAVALPVDELGATVLRQSPASQGLDPSLPEVNEPAPDYVPPDAETGEMEWHAADGTTATPSFKRWTTPPSWSMDSSSGCE